MKTAKQTLYTLPDIMGKQLSPKEHAKKMKQLDKDMKIAISKHNIRQKKKRSTRKKSLA